MPSTTSSASTTETWALPPGARLLVGQIAYLNSQPFYPLLGEHRLIPTPPSELGRMAKSGEIDAGILATADYLACEERYEPVGGLGIANHEEVRSILLASRRPIEELTKATIGVTEETSTSVRLLRLLLEVRYGLEPLSYVRGLRDGADAFLLIGNEALSENHRPRPGYPYRYDLASEWWAWKGLPFVFALWAIRKSIPERQKRQFRDLLERSFQEGMQQIDAIAARFAPELGRVEDLAGYLRNFHYRLGEPEMRGLDEFRRLVERYRLLEAI